MAKHDISTVVNGLSYAGKKLWVCDYRKTSTDKKAIRQVPPTEVIVVTEEDFISAGIKMPTIYYSNVGFAKLDKNGNAKLKQLVVPFDNTGYRSYTGVGLNIFDTEQECIEFYNEQVNTVANMYNIEIDNVVQRLKYELNEIEKLKR